MKDITLLVVDDHPLFRQGVADALALEQGFRVIGQAADGKHICRKAGREAVGILDDGRQYTQVSFPPIITHPGWLALADF